MIHELNKGNFKLVKPLFDVETKFVEALGVVDGNNPGWIFADSYDFPQFAIVFSKGTEGFFFGGEVETENQIAAINGYIRDVIIPRLKEQDLTYFEFSGVSPEWNRLFKRIFKERDLKYEHQILHRLTWERFVEDNHPNQTIEGEILRVDDQVFYDDGITDKSLMHEKILQWWESPEVFFRKGIAFCVVKDSQVVCVTYSGYVFENIQTFHINTLQDHRRKGYAEATSRAFLMECKERGFEPYWECDEGNIASRKLAEKLGFELCVLYRCYYFKI